MRMHYSDRIMSVDDVNDDETEWQRFADRAVWRVFLLFALVVGFAIDMCLPLHSAQYHEQMVEEGRAALAAERERREVARDIKAAPITRNTVGDACVRTWTVLDARVFNSLSAEHESWVYRLNCRQQRQALKSLAYIDARERDHYIDRMLDAYEASRE
jgi:hypothetical protein